MSELYAITIRLPWAAAIRDGVKLVENRGRAIPERFVGRPLAIHAGQAWDKAGASDPRVRRWWYGHEAQRSLEAREFASLAGRVIAVAALVDCHEVTWSGWEPEKNCCAPWGDAFYGTGGGAPAARHLVLADVVALDEPVETRGYLSVPFVLPDDVARKVMGQLPGVSGV